jgi:hypothetical protein
LGGLFRVLKKEQLFVDYDDNDRYRSHVEIIVPCYWWLVHHHAGMHSWEYSAQCRLGMQYQPGCVGLHSETDIVREAYNLLCQENGCDHNHILGSEETAEWLIRRELDTQVRDVTFRDADSLEQQAGGHTAADITLENGGVNLKSLLKLREDLGTDFIKLYHEDAPEEGCDLVITVVWE